MSDPTELRNQLSTVIDHAVGEGLWDPHDVADAVIAAFNLRVHLVGTLRVVVGLPAVDPQ